ncbi:MAG: HD domain-containing protein [Patescibacteria group bacterium]|jgi:uncharacterized protein
MKSKQIITNVANLVRKKFEGEGSGHDWWHILRVWNMAKHLNQEERADAFVVELSALLHDIADWKFHDRDESVGPRVAREILTKQGVQAATIDHVCDIVANISYKGAGVQNGISTLEGKIVQDADRLDALGAIGIGRTFAYGGHVGHAMYNPEEKPVLHQTKEAYSKSTASTVGHFYEKLLLLKDRMNTKTAKQLAKDRHKFMETFLAEFYKEWEGEL